MRRLHANRELLDELRKQRVGERLSGLRGQILNLANCELGIKGRAHPSFEAVLPRGQFLGTARDGLLAPFADFKNGVLAEDKLEELRHCADSPHGASGVSRAAGGVEHKAGIHDFLRAGKALGVAVRAASIPDLRPDVEHVAARRAVRFHRECVLRAILVGAGDSSVHFELEVVVERLMRPV